MLSIKIDKIFIKEIVYNYPALKKLITSSENSNTICCVESNVVSPSITQEGILIIGMSHFDIFYSIILQFLGYKRDKNMKQSLKILKKLLVNNL